MTIVTLEFYSKSDLPVFHFTVFADITDINGETRSNQTTVKSGYHTLSINAELPTLIDIAKKNTIMLKSVNLNGEFIPCQGEISIYFLQEKSNKFKRRIFPAPEIATMSPNEFEKLFPHEQNQIKNTFDTKGALVYNKQTNAGKEREIIMDFIYWQYFEESEKINQGNTNVLGISKELFLKKNTSSGLELQRITNEKSLKPGDLVTIRMIITAKEEMEFVHLKDMRAAAFEPVNVISEYKWQDRLGFYMSTKDAATHFFFDRISKGVFVLEYDIRVNNSGEFSNGISTIQSMYAPEFSGHSKGIRIKINE